MPESYYLRGVQFITKPGQLIFADPVDGDIFSDPLNCPEYERGVLEKADPLAGNKLPEASIQAWFSGKMGASATRFNNGQLFYFSPVGYMHRITDDQEVIANFKADGNVGQTCELSYVNPQGQTVIKAVCKAIMDNHELRQAIEKAGGLSNDFFQKAIKDLNAIDHKEGIKYVNELMQTYPNNTDLGKILRDCIRGSGIKLLQDYYKEKGHQARYSGTGITASTQFSEAEKAYATAAPGTEVVIGKKQHKGVVIDDLGKYTECVIHGTAANLSHVFASIDRAPIVYSAVEEASWKIPEQASEATAKAAVAARLTGMLTLYTEFKKIKKNIELAVFDEDGLLYTTNDTAHIDTLINICQGQDPDWRENLRKELKQNFTRIGVSVANDLEAFEPNLGSEAIQVVKKLPLVKTRQTFFKGVFQTGLSEMYPSMPLALKNQLDSVFTKHVESIHSGNFTPLISDVRRLYLQYHPDKHGGEVQPGYHELYKLIESLRGPNKHQISQEILAIVDKSLPSAKEESPSVTPTKP